METEACTILGRRDVIMVTLLSVLPFSFPLLPHASKRSCFPAEEAKVMGSRMVLHAAGSPKTHNKRHQVDPSYLVETLALPIHF